MTKKTGVLIILISMLLFIAKTEIVIAANLTTYADSIESMVEISDIVEKEWLKSVDSAQFEPLNSRDLNAQKDFLWSPDGSKLLILTQTYIKTKNASDDDKKLFTRCSPGPFGIPERVSDVLLINADGSELTNIVRTETSIRTAKNNTASFIPLSFIDSAESVEWSSDSDKIVLIVVNPCDDYSNSLYILNINGSTLSEIKDVVGGVTQWNPDRSKIAILDKGRTRIYLTDLENSTVKQIPLGISVGYYHIAYSTAWSPDGEKIAFIGSEDGEIYTVNIHNSSVQQLTTTMGARGLSWKPDGKKLVVVTEDGLYVMDADGSNPTLIGKGNFYFGSWSPDGRKIVFTDVNKKENSYKSYILVFNEVTTKLISPASGSGRFLAFVSWSPDGRKMLFSETDETGKLDKLHVFDLESGETKLIASALVVENVIPEGISWSPDSQRIAFYSSYSNSIYTIKPDGAGKVAILESYYKYGWGLDSKIYYFTNDSLIRVNQDGTEQLTLIKDFPSDDNWHRIFISPDGSRILFTSGNYSTWQERIYVLKMKGYDEVISIYTPSYIREGDEVSIEVKSMSKPVENAVVSLNDKEIGVTNETGFLKYNFKEAGNYRLSAVKQGFRTANMSMTIKERSHEPTVITTVTPASIVANNTPRMPGFSSIFALIVLILTVYQIKTRGIK